MAGQHLLLTAETFFNRDGVMGIEDNGTHIPVPFWAAWRYTGSGMGRSYVPPQGDATEPSIRAFVERGMWIVQCPMCTSAQVVAADDHRFFCVGDPGGCGNYYVGHQTIPVIWPEDWAEIEAALVLRPQMFQNWLTSETVDDLHEENVKYGVVDS